MENMEQNKEIKEDKGVVSPETADIEANQHSGDHHSSDHHSGSHHSSHHHGSHHGSHHGGHHSSHHGKRRSSKHHRRSRNFRMRKEWAIAICALFLLLAVAVIFLDTRQPHVNGDQQSPASDNLVVEVNNPNGMLVKNAIHQYLLADILNPANANILPSTFSKSEGRLDMQVPVSLNLSVKEGIVFLYKIELARNDLFSDAEVYYLAAAFGVQEFKHLYTNTVYYYRVTVYTSAGSESLVGSFKTEDTPRILSIDGLSNVRDIGNWRTDSGKRIKQGLLIRGTEMDGAVESGYYLTNEGLMDMLEVFGIKTDIDLRAQTATSKDALGSRVDHKYYDMVQYDDIFTDYGKEKIRMVFADLANPENYPIYLHCTYGYDRTGTVCYLLEALLGVSRGDCLKEYGLSNLNIANIQVIENGLKAYEGDTLKEQVESYLLSCGLSEYQINSIRNIFLGD